MAKAHGRRRQGDTPHARSETVTCRTSAPRPDHHPDRQLLLPALGSRRTRRRSAGQSIPRCTICSSRANAARSPSTATVASGGRPQSQASRSAAAPRHRERRRLRGRDVVDDERVHVVDASRSRDRFPRSGRTRRATRYGCRSPRPCRRAVGGERGPRRQLAVHDPEHLVDPVGPRGRGRTGVRSPSEQLGVEPVNQGLVGLAAADEVDAVIVGPGPHLGLAGRRRDRVEQRGRRVGEQGEQRVEIVGTVGLGGLGRAPDPRAGRGRSRPRTTAPR